MFKASYCAIEDFNEKDNLSFGRKVTLFSCLHRSEFYVIDCEVFKSGFQIIKFSTSWIMSLVQGNLLKGIENCSGVARSVVCTSLLEGP